MRSLLGILPFIAVPFLESGVTSSGRMLAFAGLGFLTFRSILEAYYFNRSEEIPAVYSPFHVVLMLGGILFYFTLDDLWYRYAVWPNLALGVLFVAALTGQRQSILPGLALACVLLWLVIVGFSPQSGFFPLERFPSLVARAYPMDYSRQEDILPFQHAILSPGSGAPARLVHLTVMLTTTLLFVFAFSPAGRQARGGQWGLLAVWFLAIHGLLGNGIFVLAGIHFLLFVFWTDFSESLSPKAKRVWLASIGMIGAAGCLGGLHLLLAGIAPWFDMGDRLFPETITLKVLHIAQPGALFSEIFPGGNDGLLSFILAAGILFLFIESGMERYRGDVLLPAGAALLLMGLLAVLPSWRAVFTHPLTWLGVACAQNASLRQAVPPLDPRHKIAMVWIPSAVGGLTAVLLLMGFWTVSPEWSAERSLSRFAKLVRTADLVHTAQAAFQSAPYRGDLAALHATAVAQSMIQEGYLPSEVEMRTLGYALQLAKRYGYIPFLAIKRLSDYYSMKNDRARALDVLHSAVDQFPGQLPLQEMLAERLESFGRTELALQVYQKCADLNPAAVRYRIKLARLYQTMNDLEKAKQEWHHVRILDPTQPIPQW
ncbi:MAG TPA: tetratricopeptide repeat protein [bacterium]|nr:tetratricopeptide repeat protein [bacterium]HXK92874.1 tetratricopeptide repeat protein [bacterium]